jgi:glucose/arabinose dehydrogenase
MRRSALSYVLLRLALVSACVVLASRAAPLFNLMVGPLRGSKNSPLDWNEVIRILATMLVPQAIFHTVSFYRARRDPLANLNGFVTELWGALAATSVGACWLFVMTVVPFSPNFYAYVYLILIIAHVAVYVVASLTRGARLAHAFDGSGAVARRFISPTFLASGLVIVLPGALAVLYKKSERFSNAVNATRASVNVGITSRWTLRPVIPGKAFEQPMWLEFDPLTPDRFYVLSRPGRLYRYDRASGASEVLLDLSSEVGSVVSEMGAMSFSLHPRFGRTQVEQRGFVYIFYTTFHDGVQTNRLTRFDISLADLHSRGASRLPLIEQHRPPTGQHNGGTTFFGPDGFLYFTIGDFMSGYGQTIDEKLSAGVFRIDVDKRTDVSGPILNQPKEGTTANYLIPKDNPWYNRPGALGEFWALGFRNPFRAWLDSTDGSVWLGDIGEDQFEEIDHVRMGDNGQWPFREGQRITDKPVPQNVLGRQIGPVHAYEQTALDRAVIGGPVYRGTRLPGLKDRLIIGDNNSSTVFAVDLQQKPPRMTPLARANKLGQQGITSLSPSPDGSIWITVLGAKAEHSGLVLELVPDASTEQPTKPPSSGSSVEQKFEAVCSRCHGSDGRGNPGLAQVTQRPDFTSAAWQSKATDERIREVIARGGAAVGLSRDMPAWQGFLDEAELSAMVRKIRGFAGPSKPN